MPMKYDSLCSECGKHHEYIAKIKDRNNTPECCDKPTTRMIVAPMVQSSTAREYQAYKCPHSGDLITSKKQRTEVMKKHNLVEAEPL